MHHSLEPDATPSHLQTPARGCKRVELALHHTPLLEWKATPQLQRTGPCKMDPEVAGLTHVKDMLKIWICSWNLLSLNVGWKIASTVQGKQKVSVSCLDWVLACQFFTFAFKPGGIFWENHTFQSLSLSFFFFFFKVLSEFILLFFYFFLFLAVLGLRFCARALSSCGERGSLFIAVRGPLTVTAFSLFLNNNYCCL